MVPDCGPVNRRCLPNPIVTGCLLSYLLDGHDRRPSAPAPPFLSLTEETMIGINDGGGGIDIVATATDFFSATGPLSRSPDFEFRAEQQDMARHVAQALQSGHPLAVEAGTGVGKSLAYLVPAILFGQAHRRKAIISTHTINLQEQLIHKDIPILQKIHDLPFAAALLKGRGNYLCMSRLRRAMRNKGDLFSSSEQDDLKMLWDWAHETEDGSRSDLPHPPSPGVWNQVCSESLACSPRICGKEPLCFFQAARRRAMEADLVVMNHTLFFTLLASSEENGAAGDDHGFLYPRDFAIFDEAHTLEAVAAAQLGMRLSCPGILFDLRKLFNPRTKKGLFPLLGEARGVEATLRLIERVESFFGEVEDACNFGPWGREFRVRNPIGIDDPLAGPLRNMAALLREAADRTDKEPTRLELEDLAERMLATRAGVAEFLDLGQEGHVYWVERSGNREGSAPPQATLRSAPIDIAGLCREIFFDRSRTCVMTSATLGTGETDLRYFRNRIGGENIECQKIGSPFDYRKQMQLYLVKAMPDPGDPAFPDELEKWIRHFLLQSDGRAFVLFTSYKLLKDMAARLAQTCTSNGWRLLVQGQEMARDRMVRIFREDKHSVLFGTDSFWTGVDVPGEALSNVIVTRLPFAVPDHPVTASQIEKIQAEGGNAFYEYSLPEAVVKLRQGIGRLIRTKKDKGIAVILDSRVLSKSYGRRFLAGLPSAPTITLGKEDI